MAHRKSLKNPRSHAYQHQQGLCYYCGQPMWQDNPERFAQQHRLTPAQVRWLQCTGEHLMAHADGGKADRHNIVAACYYCNSRRHRRASPLEPEKYQVMVEKRVEKGKWHRLRLAIRPQAGG